MRRIRFRSRRFPAIALLGVLIVAAIALIWFASPAGEPMPEALLALETDSRVRVDRGGFIAFRPLDSAPSSGFIFYPGGRVVPEAYAPLARALAESGLLAVITPMPLNFALLQPDAATHVIAAYPRIETWLIGGHSLGGVMAARYAHDHPERVAGLVLLSAYPESHIDLSELDLAVATIYGDQDGLVAPDEIADSLSLLPPDALTVRIEGGNHAGFGHYGEQDGDRPASITREAQRMPVLAAIADLTATVAAK